MKIAIIPARGGSKRIKNKNIKLFNGKPIIAYSIAAAQLSGCFDKIFVSTDDPAIAGVAKQYGAQVPFLRPAALADDFATTADVMQHALMWCNEQSLRVEAACCIYATAPFLTPEALQEGNARLAEGDCEYVFAAAQFSSPIWRSFALDEQKRASMFFPEHLNTRSQDLPCAFFDAAQFYWGTARALLEKKPMFAAHAKAIVLPQTHVQDIDTMDDWLFAQALHRIVTS
ncbi:MAG: pseudaminic acid cytidylyltransferase [Vibrionaceae bacterium]